MASERQWETIARYVGEAIDQHPPELAEDLRALVAADRFRVIAVFDLDDQDQPIAASLSYRVDLFMSDGWAGIAKVHWSLIPGIGTAEVELELANIRAQQDMGISVESWAGDLP